MTEAQYTGIIAIMQEVSDQIIILQVGTALLVFSAFASLIYAWRK